MIINTAVLLIDTRRTFKSLMFISFRQMAQRVISAHMIMYIVFKNE